MKKWWGTLVVAVALAATAACGQANPTRSSAPAAPPASAPVQRESGPSGSQDSGGGSGAAPAPSSGNSSSGSAQTIDRMIIRNASLTLQVSNIDTAIDEATSIARDSGGFVFSTNFSNVGEGNSRAATMELRVPSSRYEDVLARLRKASTKVVLENSSAQDVTEEYSDLQAQLRNLEATEAQYQELLRRANSIDDIIKVQQRLSETRSQIERTKGRIVYLERRSDLANIKVSFVTEATTRIEPAGAWEPVKVAISAWNASMVLLQGLANVVIFLVVFFWWLIPFIAALIGFIWFRMRNGRRRPAAPTTGTAAA